MALFTALTLAGGVVVASVAARRKADPLRLVDVLIDGEPKRAILLPPPTQQALSRVKTVSRDLFGDTRQQQQQALNATYAGDEEQNAETTARQNLIITATGLGLATAGFVVSPLFYLPSALCALYATRMFFQDAWDVYQREKRLDYRAIWALTVPVALAGGYVWTANFGMIFGLANYYLVSKTENRAKRTVADLFGGQINTVWLLVDGVEVETPFSAVQVGDTVVVHAGQMIPVDGRITQGTATIDQHMLTGEAQPVEKGEGDTVLASTVVLAGRLCIRVETAGDATVASQITTMLSQTTDFKQTLQSRTDHMLNQMTVPLLALTALAWPLAGVGGAAAVLWYYPGSRMMLFGPMSMLSYLQVAAQRGILVKDGRALENLEQIDTVVFDKTGTLTLEQPTVSRVLCYNGVAELDVLRYAAAAEAKQSHPIARAILQAAREHELDLPLLEDAAYKVGYGLKTQIGGRTTRVGSIRFMRAEGMALPVEVATDQAESHALGHSLVLVALDGEVVGAIELQPTIRPEARAIIDDLHERKIETVIISGDNDAPTRRLATELGIDRYFAEVLPEDKANLVTQLQEEGHKVCFVGDGINDSIALKTADVAVSLRGATTIATDMAEIVFMDGTLGQLPELFTLADDFAANMRTNMLASIVPGALGIAGTLLFGWGMGICVLLSQGSTPVGIYNAIKPMLDEQKQQEQLLA
ncbi:MAG: heavy metal translocating P-type ATPase [Caldilineaceae bacterium]|nr:heavy metal translocating P-type ATPase [Caldilineaceae bacterium]